MPWLTPTLRTRREQARDDVDARLPGADSRVPNTKLRAMSEAQANMTHDNDLHLAWVARMMMPDKAEDEFVDRWAGIWLPAGRKPASFSAGYMTVTGDVGAIVNTGAELTANVFDDEGVLEVLTFVVTEGVTLSAGSAAVAIEALSAGALGNLIEGTSLDFVELPAGIDGQATIAAPGLAGGADRESDEDCIARYIDVIQKPPHGGRANDYVQWARDYPGVTRAWGAQEMGVGTYTVRVMMDDLFADTDGIPDAAAVAAVEAYIDTVRPVTVAERYILAPIAQTLDVTVTGLANDTPEVRANIEIELRAMLRARAKPGGTIWGSWITEAIASATGEDHHSGGYSDVPATSSGHIIVLGTVSFV